MPYEGEVEPNNPYDPKARRERALLRQEREANRARIPVAVHLADAAARRHHLVPDTKRYDPFRDVACGELRIPYGMVRVGGSAAHSYEMVITAPSPLDPDETRRDCLIDPAVSFVERETYRRNRAWAAGEGVDG